MEDWNEQKLFNFHLMKEHDKVFILKAGKNDWDNFLSLNEIFSRVRRVAVNEPEGFKRGGWRQFGKALKDLVMTSWKNDRRWENWSVGESCTRQKGPFSYADVVKKRFYPSAAAPLRGNFEKNKISLLLGFLEVVLAVKLL